MKLDSDRVEQYLTHRFGRKVELLELRPLTDDGVTTVNGNQTRRLKTFGYGEPIFVQYRIEGTETSAVLHTMAENAFGHERRADRALVGIPVREAMTWDPATISPDNSIQDAAERMVEYQVSGLPVINGIELVGIGTILRY